MAEFRGTTGELELVIFMGLQTSGKSTFFHKYFAATHEHVSKDLMRNNKKPSRRQAQLIELALQAGRSVVVDNTNPTLDDRASIIELGKLYGTWIVGYYFESKVSACRDRNQQRLGKARVPDIAIYATIKKLVRPSYAEGFNQLFYVRMAGDLDFKVQAWTNSRAIES